MKAPAAILERFDINSPFADYYFDNERLLIMDLIQSANLDLPFLKTEWPEFHEKSIMRAQLESGDVITLLGKMRGRNYADMFTIGLDLIVEARNASHKPWVGLKDVWIIEFFAALARYFSEAKFIVVQRDPRAVIASMSALAKKDPTQKAHILSFARHWRKYLAFICHYQSLPLFRDRIFVVRYEDLTAKTEKTLQGLCQFLSTPFDRNMVDSRNYLHRITGKPWKGNSSFQESMYGIESGTVDKWRQELDGACLRTIELICGPDMELAGYSPVTNNSSNLANPEVLSFLINDDKTENSWRSDFGDIQLDYGFELFRRSTLKMDDDLPVSLVRRSFLFEDVYDRLRRYG
jgi:hypothetical protein